MSFNIPARFPYLSAYGIAVKHGFVGTEEEWLESIKGKPIEVKYEDGDLWYRTVDSGGDWLLMADLSDLQSSVIADTIAEAQAAATAAALSETNAAVSEANAAASEANAESYKNLSQQAANNAAISENNATQAASDALGNATQAAAYASSAEISANDAISAEQNSELAKSIVLTSEANALEYKNAAETAATTASGAAAVAVNKAIQSEQSASAASGERATAEQARNDAEEFENAASISAAASVTNKALAVQAKTAAEAARNIAMTKAGEAEVSAASAAESAAKASSYIPEDGKMVRSFYTSGTGASYTAEIEGYTEYKPGDLFVMIPHANMTGEPCTLNINELGAKTLRRLCGDMASGSIPVAEPAFIIAGVPIRLMYKPDCFILLDRPQALGGNDFADAVSVGKGGTGKTAWSTNRLVYASASNALAQVAQPDGERLLGQNSSGEPYWVEVDATADFFSTNPVQSNAVAELSNQLAVHKQYNLVPGDRGAHGLKYDVVGNKFQYSTNDYNWTDIVLGGGGSYKKIGYTDDCDYVVSSSSGGKAVFDTAISAASDGDIIMVMDGIYGYPYGSTGAAKRVTISKNITFISGGGSRPTISFDVYVDGNLDTGASYKLTVKDIDFTGSVSTYGDTNYEQYQSCDSTIYAFNCSFGNAIIHGMFHGCVFSGSISDPGNSFSVGHIFNDCKFNNTTISMSGGMMSTSFINCTFNSGSNAISISAFGLTFNNCFFYSNVTGSVICDTNGASYDMLCDCKVFGVPLTLPDGCSTRSYQFSGTAI